MQRENKDTNNEVSISSEKDVNKLREDLKLEFGNALFCGTTEFTDQVADWWLDRLDRAVAERDKEWEEAFEKQTGGLVVNVSKFYKKVEEKLKESKNESKKEI